MMYLLLKSLHVVAVLGFASGLLLQVHVLRLYRGLPLPQMPDERQLLLRVQYWDRLVTVPALTLTWIFGLAAALHAGWFASGWLKAKLVCVVLLSMLHGLQSGELRRLALAATAPGKATLAGHALVPVYLLIGAVTGLAVFKPW